MKVLIIGNKCTVQMISYLPALSTGAGKELLLSNLTVKSASLEKHYRNYTDEVEDYTYETYLPGISESMKPDGIALHEAVEDDDWDKIIFCQNLSLSGISDSYKPYLGELAGYCKLMHPSAELMLIEPYPFEDGCKKEAFSKAYDSSTDEMLDKIKKSCAKAVNDADIDTLLPLGSYIKSAKEYFNIDRITSNGVDLNDTGKLLSACCLYSFLFDERASASNYQPAGFDINISKKIKNFDFLREI